MHVKLDPPKNGVISGVEAWLILFFQTILNFLGVNLEGLLFFLAVSCFNCKFLAENIGQFGSISVSPTDNFLFRVVVVGTG